MIMPNLKQGGCRSKPDGFLHLNNFCHSVKSGLAGCMFERVFTDKQRTTIESILIELASQEMARAVDFKQLFHYKHNVYRFEKEFLIQNFQRVVYGYCKITRLSASATMALAVTGEIIEVANTQGIAKVKMP